MSTPSSKEVIQLLLAWGQGDRSALDRLAPLVYEELHRLAHRYIAKERPGRTLQTTVLVNPACLRLIDSSQVQGQNRTHLLAVSAQLMRRILVDFARVRRSLKRGGEAQHVSEEALLPPQEKGADLVALDDALTALAAIDPRQAEAVELRFFGGLTVEETAEVLKVSPETVHRDWRVAKAWLLRELSRNKRDDTRSLGASQEDL